MSRVRSGRALVGVLALTAAVAAGCDTVGVDGTGELKVTMQRVAGQTGTQTVSGGFASVANGSSKPIDGSNVLSLTVEITSIQFLPAVADDGADDAGSWIFLTIVPVELDLMALPTVGGGEPPLVIAAGRVLAGDYRSVRLFVGDATIVFQAAVSVGQAMFAEAVDHAVTIPSGAETGLKTDLAFTVENDSDGNAQELNLLFDEGATFQNATATGNGTVILSPVLRN